MELLLFLILCVLIYGIIKISSIHRILKLRFPRGRKLPKGSYLRTSILISGEISRPHISYTVSPSGLTRTIKTFAFVAYDSLDGRADYMICKELEITCNETYKIESADSHIGYVKAFPKSSTIYINLNCSEAAFDLIVGEMTGRREVAIHIHGAVNKEKDDHHNVISNNFDFYLEGSLLGPKSFRIDYDKFYSKSHSIEKERLAEFHGKYQYTRATQD
jgi:hypothetical protein